MKRRILIAIHYMHLGGVETSLLGLLSALNYEKYDVDLFVYSHQGPLMAELPQQVRLLPQVAEYAQVERPLARVLKDGYWRIGLARLKAKWKFRRHVAHHPEEQDALFAYVADAVLPCLPAVNSTVEYDLAISYLAPHHFVLQKVRARRRACWIHTDYSAVHVNALMELPVWGAYDHIVSISPAVTAAFAGVFPALRDKICQVENILSAAWISQRANWLTAAEVEREMPRQAGTFNLLSVGRYSQAKNYDNVPDICRRLSLLLPFDIRWYIIGYGSDEALIRQRIREAGMEGRVVLLGKKDNPYPYIKACDLYVQPSRYEGNSVTVREAQLLGRPVAVAAYQTASSQVEDGVDGVIVPQDNEGCAQGLAQLLSDSTLLKRLSENVGRRDYSRTSEAEKVEFLFE